MALRLHFNERLEDIRSDVVRMGGEANEMVRKAVEATLNGDLILAAEVIKQDDRVDDFEKLTLNKTIVVLMQEAPVARDLRFLVSTMGVVGEIEKIGDDAVKLCRRTTKLNAPFPMELKVALMDLGEQARRSFSSSMRLFCEFDSSLAEEIISGDKQIDTAYSRARDHVIKLIQEKPAETGSLVRVIEIFHALEHVADHSVAIAIRLRMHFVGPQ